MDVKEYHKIIHCLSATKLFCASRPKGIFRRILLFLIDSLVLNEGDNKIYAMEIFATKMKIFQFIFVSSLNGVVF